MADMQTLGLEVKSTGLAPAAKNVQALGEAAKKYDAAISTLESTLKSLSNSSLTDFSNQISKMAGSLKSSGGYFERMGSALTGFKGGSQAFTNVANAAERLAGQSVALGVVATQLASIQQSLEGMKGSAGVLRQATGTSTGGGRSGGRSAPSASDNSTQAYTTAQKRLLSQLEREAYLVDHTKEQYLELRAAKLGVTDAAAPYISQMKKMERTTDTMGMTQRGYNAALRGVPAQFTDIVVSLQSGQRPLTVLMQQGGQLKDMFGGAGNALKVLGQYVLSLINPFTILAATVGVLAYGFFKGNAESAKFRQSLASTNNYIGMTNDQFLTLSKSIGKSTAEGAEVLTALAASGKIASKDIGGLATAVLGFSKISGESLEQVVKHFEDLGDAPAKTLLELDKKYHFLTTSTYAQVAALEAQGNKAAAVEIAQKAMMDAANKGVPQMTENLGYLEKGWRNLTSWITWAKDALTDLGRDSTQKEALHKVNLELIAMIDWYDRLVAKGTEASKKQAADVLLEVNALRAKKEAMDKGISSQEKSAALQAKELQDSMQQKDILSDFYSSTNKMLTSKERLQKIEETLLANGIDRTKVEAYIATLKDKQLSTLDKQQNKEKERLKTSADNHAATMAQLNEQLAAMRNRTTVTAEQQKLIDNGVLVTAKGNEYLAKAARLEEEATKAKTNQEAVQLRKEASIQRELGLTQQSVTQHESQLKFADSLRSTYDSQTQQLADQLRITLASITANETLSAPEKARYETLVKQTNEMKKQQMISSLTGDSRKLVDVEYKQSKSSLNAEFDTMLQGGVDPVEVARLREEAIQNLERTTADKRIEAWKQYMVTNSIGTQTLLAGIEAVSSAAGTQIAGLIKGTSSFKDVLNSLGDTILNAVVGSLVQWGVKRLWLAAIEQAAAVETATTTQAVAAATTAASVAEAATVTAAWTPAATAASVATFGAAAFTGASAYVAALGITKSAATATSMFDNGGMIPAGKTGIVGEYGPEMVTGPAYVTSRKDTAKALASGGNGGGTTVNMQIVDNAGVQVSQTQDSEGNIIMTLDKYLPGYLAKAGANPKSSLNKAQSSIYNRRRN